MLSLLYCNIFYYKHKVPGCKIPSHQKTARKRCQEPFLGPPLFLSVISRSNFFRILFVQLSLPEKGEKGVRSLF